MIPGKYLHILPLLRNERRPLERLRALQDRKLRALIRHAYANVPFQRERFQAAGLRPEDIRSARDLEKLPVVDKSDIQRADLDSLLDRRIRDRDSLLAVRTSGSSGHLLTFFMDRAYDQYRKAQFLRPYLSNGCRITDRVLRVSIHDQAPRRWFQRLGLMRERRVHPAGEVADHIDALRRFRPDTVIGYGSVLSAIAAALAEEAPGGGLPRRIFTDSELLTPQRRRTIEDAFGAAVFDVYGTYETDNIAYECAAHAGYHMAVDSVVLEFLAGERACAPGEEGEIVCTVLDNYAMPFIRYNLNDVGASTNEPCPCGRTFPLMTVIAGRSDDAVEFEGASRCSGVAFLSSLQRLASSVREFQIIQETLRRFRVAIVPAGPWSAETERVIREDIRSVCPDAEVNIRLVARIERGPGGKHRSFISRLPARGAAHG